MEKLKGLYNIISMICFCLFVIGNQKNASAQTDGRFSVDSIVFNMNTDSISFYFNMPKELNPPITFNISAFNKNNFKIGKGETRIVDNGIQLYKVKYDEFFNSLFYCFLNDNNITKIELKQQANRNRKILEYSDDINFDMNKFYYDFRRFLHKKFENDPAFIEYINRRLEFGVSGKFESWNNFNDQVTVSPEIISFSYKIRHLAELYCENKNNNSAIFINSALQRQIDEFERYLIRNGVNDNFAEPLYELNLLKSYLKTGYKSPLTINGLNFSEKKELEELHISFSALIDTMLYYSRDNNQHIVDSVLTFVLPIVSVNLKYDDVFKKIMLTSDKIKGLNYEIHQRLNAKSSKDLLSILTMCSIMNIPSDIIKAIDMCGVDVSNLIAISSGILSTDEQYVVLLHILDVALSTKMVQDINGSLKLQNTIYEVNSKKRPFTDLVESNPDYFLVKKLGKVYKGIDKEKIYDGIKEEPNCQLNQLTYKYLDELLFYELSDKISAPDIEVFAKGIRKEHEKTKNIFDKAKGFEKEQTINDFNNTLNNYYKKLYSGSLVYQGNVERSFPAFKTLYNEIDRCDSILSKRIQSEIRPWTDYKIDLFRKTRSWLSSDISSLVFLDSIINLTNKQIDINHCLKHYCPCTYENINMCISKSADVLPTYNVHLDEFKNSIRRLQTNKYKTDSLYLNLLANNILTEIPYKRKEIFYSLPLDEQRDFVLDFIKRDTPEVIEVKNALEEKNITNISNIISSNIKLDEKIISDHLSHKINFLNMDAYVGPGLYFFRSKILSDGNPLQPINFYFSTRLDTSKWGKDNFWSKWQPFTSGSFQTYSGRGAYGELGYGLRLYGSQNFLFAFNPFISGIYYNTSGWSIDTLTIKSFYETEIGIDLSISYLKSGWFNGGTLNMYAAFPSNPIRRTFTISDLTPNVEEGYDWSFKILGTLHFCNSRVLIKGGFKNYVGFENKNLKPYLDFYTSLWTIQILIKLNK